MHDVIRSLKESRRFERMSSAKFSTTSTADLYELVLACDGDEQLAGEMFSPRYRLPSRSRGTVTELEGEGAGARRRSSAAMTLATPAQGRKVLHSTN